MTVYLCESAEHPTPLTPRALTPATFHLAVIPVNFKSHTGIVMVKTEVSSIHDFNGIIAGERADASD